jgi:hypothetical protein
MMNVCNVCYMDTEVFILDGLDPDYGDPAIHKDFGAPGETIFLATCWPSQEIDHPEQVLEHAALAKRFPGIETFPGRLAVALCRVINPGHRDLPAIDQGVRRKPGDRLELDCVPESFIKEFLTGVDMVQTFRELKFAIDGNPGTLRVRTHTDFHGKKRESAVAVLAPEGMLHPSDDLVLQCHISLLIQMCYI